MKNLVKKVDVVPNWKRVFFTWSFWFHIASVLLTFIDQILPFVGLLEPTMTTQTYAILMFTLNALGLLSRFIKQKNLWQYPEENQEDEKT
jgi:hypothetical protein